MCLSRWFFFFQAEDGIRYLVRSRGLGDVYKRQGHHSAHMASDDWITPREIIAALGPFDLDPCASATQPWPTAEHMLTVKDNLSLIHI